jgi:hypothetical protein
MSYEPPTPPAALPTDIVTTLNGYSPDQLQHVARYAEELAEHKAREARLEEESEDDEIDERPDGLGRRPVEGHDHDQGDQRQPLLLLAVERW